MKKLLLLPLALIFLADASAQALQGNSSENTNADILAKDQAYTNLKSHTWPTYHLLKERDIQKDLNILVNELKYDAADIEEKGQLVNLRYDKSSGLIRLDNRVLYEDDGPATGKPEGSESYGSGPVGWVEDLKDGIVIKKNLLVDNPHAVSGKLVFKGMEVEGNTEPLHLSLNGEEFVRPASRVGFPDARQYIDLQWDRWFYVDIPVDNLRQGKNEIKMWTTSESTSWRILIAADKEFKRGSLNRTSHPNRSKKSSDGGKTWSDKNLGAFDSMDGEYSVRLNLNQYFPSGEYVSPLVDLIDSNKQFKRNVKDVKTVLHPQIKEPEKTNSQIFIRFGASPIIGNKSWTDWQPLERGREYAVDDKRYMQWRAELKTDDPLKTPALKGLEITSFWENDSPNRNAGLKVHVRNNGDIQRSSYPFAYEDLNHTELQKYRKDNNLDQIIAGATSEFEVFMRLLHWAYRVPITHEAYSWNWNKVTVDRSEDGMPELNGPDFGGRRMVGMCLYPNQALIGALLSLGYQARHINIHSEGISGHEVTEVWSNQFNKWIYMDATRDYYYFDPETGIPMNLLEIHNLLVEEMPRVETWERPFAPEIGEEIASQIDVGMRQGDNPYSIEEGGGRHILEMMGYFRIIPRNDFLSNPRPVPVHTGNTMWGWTGFLNWYDQTFPKRYEYDRYSNRGKDFYEPLNQAKVFLSETEKSGVLEVEVEIFVPGGFDTLLVYTGDEWIPREEKSWRWNLKSGLNILKIRTRNVRGVLGPISHLNVTFNP